MDGNVPHSVELSDDRNEIPIVYRGVLLIDPVQTFRHLRYLGQAAVLEHLVLKEIHVIVVEIREVVRDTVRVPGYSLKVLLQAAEGPAFIQNHTPAPYRNRPVS